MNTMYPINHLEEVKVKQTKNLKEIKTFHFMNISWTFLLVQDLEEDQALQLTMLEGLALLQNCKI